MVSNMEDHVPEDNGFPSFVDVSCHLSFAMCYINCPEKVKATRVDSHGLGTNQAIEPDIAYAF